MEYNAKRTIHGLTNPTSPGAGVSVEVSVADAIRIGQITPGLIEKLKSAKTPQFEIYIFESLAIRAVEEVSLFGDFKQSSYFLCSPPILYEYPELDIPLGLLFKYFPTSSRILTFVTTLTFLRYTF